MKLSVRALAALAAIAALAALGASAGSAAGRVACPNGGTVRFGVEPYDSSPKFAPAYKALASAIQKNLGCKVQLIIAQNYTAEIEAMRAKKLEVGEFGPLGYIFANTLARAVPVAAFGDKNHKPVTYTAAIWAQANAPIAGVAQLKGHTVAFSDPASTSGNLFPRFALIKAGLNPDKDVTIQFAGSHSASLLALTNGKVDAAEVNSQQQTTASAAGQFDASKFKLVWRSAPIPNDPITVRSDLPKAFQVAFKKAVLKLSPAQLKLVDAELGVDSGPMVPAGDALYKPIRDVVQAENLDLKSIG